MICIVVILFLYSVPTTLQIVLIKPKKELIPDQNGSAGVVKTEPKLKNPLHSRVLVLDN